MFSQSRNSQLFWKPVIFARFIISPQRLAILNPTPQKQGNRRFNALGMFLMVAWNWVGVLIK
jgi:hypothetical protein